MSEDTQREELAYLINHVCEHGFQPTVSEMAEHFGVTPRAIRDRMEHLVRKGFLVAPVKRMERCWAINRVSDEWKHDKVLNGLRRAIFVPSNENLMANHREQPP